MRVSVPRRVCAANRRVGRVHAKLPKRTQMRRLNSNTDVCNADTNGHLLVGPETLPIGTRFLTQVWRCELVLQYRRAREMGNFTAIPAKYGTVLADRATVCTNDNLSRAERGFIRVIAQERSRDEAAAEICVCTVGSLRPRACHKSGQIQ